MANYFPIALIGMTWAWLMNLPEGLSPLGKSCAVSS
jgi:hypothetical protein